MDIQLLGMDIAEIHRTRFKHLKCRTWQKYHVRIFKGLNGQITRSGGMINAEENKTET